MVIVRAFCVGWIEFWRGVPMIAVLFIAITMFPFFMPRGIEINELLRALIAFTVVVSSFLADAIRGGLQSLPKGQYDAARALGLGYWRAMGLIILPQAIAAAFPAIVNILIALIKETTLVLIIGLYDVLGIVQSAALDPEWFSGNVLTTGYAAVAAVFWMLCFGLSRYSIRIERTFSRDGGSPGAAPP